jgi:hypothetical protein
MRVRIMVALFALLVPFSGVAQERKLPMHVSQIGHDQVGALFSSAFKRELSQSARYEFSAPQETKNGSRFYVELMTVDVADNVANQGKRSAISIVIENMGLPKSFPVPSKWYHKLVLVDRQTVDKIAKDLLDDIDASWCNQITNSVGGCPKEKLEPIFGAHP